MSLTRRLADRSGSFGNLGRKPSRELRSTARRRRFHDFGAGWLWTRIFFRFRSMLRLKANVDSFRSVYGASPESVQKCPHRGVSESDTTYLFPIGMHRTAARARGAAPPRPPPPFHFPTLFSPTRPSPHPSLPSQRPSPPSDAGGARRGRRA